MDEAGHRLRIISKPQFKFALRGTCRLWSCVYWIPAVSVGEGCSNMDSEEKFGSGLQESGAAGSQTCSATHFSRQIGILLRQFLVSRKHERKWKASGWKIYVHGDSKV
jgi:hypothetical protein